MYFGKDCIYLSGVWESDNGTTNTKQVCFQKEQIIDIYRQILTI